MPDLKLEQFRGTILGLAVGDAIGAKWEGLPADIIREMGPADEIVQHASGETIYYTDDTQMTISVVQTLLDLGSIDQEELANRFAENYHPDRGYGQGARQIINAIGSSEDWRRLSETIFNGQGSLGNGAAMRVAPVGLYFSPDTDLILQQAELSATPTHTHAIGIDGARIMAVATSLAAQSSGSDFDRCEFLQSLHAIAETEEFQWQLELAAQLQPFSSLSTFGSSLEAHRSVVSSILCFADSPDDYLGTLARAIGQGDDVDTLAAMAGALSGARLGIEAIPNNLISCLEDNHQGKSYLLEAADKLWDKYSTRDQ